MWYRFMDMHSGGGTKTDFEYIYVQADSERDARAWFEAKFDRDPDHATCKCCGADFSITEDDSLEQATAFNRKCSWDAENKKYRDDGQSLEEYLASKEIYVCAEVK